MSLLTEFRSSLENPQTPLSYPAEWLTDIYNGGRTDSGLRVSQMSALQLPVVFACVNIVASGVAGLPLNVHELGATASGRLTRKLAADHALQDLLHDRPHPEMSSFTWRFVLMCHALLFGNAFAEVLYDNGGRIAALAPRMPWKTGAVRITRDMRIADAFGDVRDVKAGTLLYKTTQGLEGEQDYTPTNPYIADPLNYNRRTERFIFPEDMLFVPGLTLDGRVGQDTIFLARQAIGLALAAEKFGAKFFGNGGHPGGLLSLIGNVDKQQMEKARETFQEATGGENMHRLLVVKGDWKYSPLSTPNDSAQFIQTRDHQVKEISSLFQVPMHMLGDSGGTNKATAEQLGMEFVNYTLGPWLPKFEQELKYKLFTLPNTRGRNSGRYEPKLDTTALMFPDAESRRNYYHNAKLVACRSEFVTGRTARRCRRGRHAALA
jgi:phage portal protein BeeE